MNSKKSSPISQETPVSTVKPAVRKPLISPNSKAEEEAAKLREERERLESDPTPNDDDVRSSIP